MTSCASGSRENFWDQLTEARASKLNWPSGQPYGCYESYFETVCLGDTSFIMNGKFCNSKSE